MTCICLLVSTPEVHGRASAGIDVLESSSFDYCSPVWSNCKVEYSSSLQILQNKLARVLLSADIRISTDDLMTTLNWDKLDKRWKKQLLLIVFKCLKHFHLNLFILLVLNARILVVSLLILFWCHSVTSSLGSVHLILEVVQFGIASQLMSDVIYFLWTYTLSKLMLSFRSCKTVALFLINVLIYCILSSDVF